MDYEKAFKEAYGRASLRFGTNIANELFLEYKESKEERTRRKLIEFFSDWSKTKSHCWGIRVTDIMDWLEKQGERESQKVSIWKHWKDGIAGNGEGKPIYLIKTGNTYNLSSCLGFECDYIELSELDNLMLEKQGEQKPNPVLDIEIPFGAKDSELQEAAYLIPEGFHAEIKDDKVLIKKGKQKPTWSKEDEEIKERLIRLCTQYMIPDGVAITCENWLKSLKQRIEG